ncbi:hypothetical protein ACE1B6_24435 [Aerosakkonemataceae cyanobacterium BLCC-F154]|uniref:Uncharacterized protein n=1 Tax=Floridaenema fluviatile BLCC-F154 TaxID=3153640 RepID=A0ABV4YHU8_9CYAN
MNLVELGIRSVLNKHFAGLSLVVSLGFLGLSVNEKEPFKTTYTSLAGISAASGYVQRKRQQKLREQLEGYGLDNNTIDAYIVASQRKNPFGINPSRPLTAGQLPTKIKLNDRQKALLEANKHFASLQLPPPRVKPTPMEMQMMMQQQAPQPVYRDAFNFDVFRQDPDQFPHILIVGATGDGKSTLAEYLGLLMSGNGGKRYAIAPHTKPDDWQGFDGVFGGGRYYGDEKDPEVSYEDIVNYRLDKPPTVSQVLKAIYAEMDRRYKLRDQGIEDYEQHEWFIDEIPAISSALKKLLAHVMEKLILEARKVKIRLWLLAQGQTVKLLGIEGKGEIRESLTYIRLGSFAKQYAKELMKSNDINPEFYQRLLEERWACMVEENYAQRPPYQLMKEAITQFSKTRLDWRSKAQNSLVSGTAKSLQSIRNSTQKVARLKTQKEPVSSESLGASSDNTIVLQNNLNSETITNTTLQELPSSVIADRLSNVMNNSVTNNSNADNSRLVAVESDNDDGSENDSYISDRSVISDNPDNIALTNNKNDGVGSSISDVNKVHFTNIPAESDSRTVNDSVLGSEETIEAFGKSWTKTELKQVALDAIAKGEKRGEIIKNIWKMGGKKYKEGCNIWNMLELPET